MFLLDSKPKVYFISTFFSFALSWKAVEKFIVDTLQKNTILSGKLVALSLSSLAVLVHLQVIENKQQQKLGKMPNFERVRLSLK